MSCTNVKSLHFLGSFVIDVAGNKLLLFASVFFFYNSFMQYLLASPSLSYSYFISRMRCSTKCHRSPYLRGREMPGGVVPLDHHFVTFVTCILIVRWSCFFEASLYRVAASPVGTSLPCVVCPTCFPFSSFFLRFSYQFRQTLKLN